MLNSSTMNVSIIGAGSTYGIFLVKRALQAILLEPRKGKHRKRVFHPAKAKWKSLAHIQI